METSEYGGGPDKRLVALLLIAMVVVPAMIAAELAVPSLQPKFVVTSPTQEGAVVSGASSSSPSSISLTKLIMPNGVNLEKTLNFEPANLVVVVGVNNSLMWTNQDTTDHTVTFTAVPSGVNANSISAGDVPPGTSFGPITLTVPGTYMYHCQFHPAWMHGVIIVKSG